MFNNFNEKGLSQVIDLKKWGISTFSLKLIAVLTMFIDHFSIVFLADHQKLYLTGRTIGRLSFPIFCFILVEGFFYTKNRLKHGILLGIFALISEVPYDLLYGSVFDLERQNVFFSLFIGYMMIWGLDFITSSVVNYPQKLLDKIGSLRLDSFMELVVMSVAFLMAYFIKCSYSYAGIMLILCFYVFRKYHIGRLVANVIFNIGMFGYSIQWFGALSAIIIAFYNNTPGRFKWKYFFYLFYPVHILVLVGIKIFLIK